MTDRLKGLTVAFESDIREDDAEFIISAIKMIKGVAGVKPNVSDHNDYINRAQLKRDIINKIYAIADDL